MLRLMLVMSVISTLVNSHSIVNDGPIVTVQQGQIQGITEVTPNGKTYNAFLGIPFGKTPLRFAAPEPADSWTDVKQCTTDADNCIQSTFGEPPVAGVEDCLTLNVYTPNLSGSALPVLVFIHGGGYFEGDNNHYGPQRFLDYTDIVIVYMNYRLSSLGFLSTGDCNCPGNYGLLDQNLALKWIQANIASFNGDPNAVTLSGESAGSASVSSHLASSYSAGLFQKTIHESGTVMSGWAIDEDPLQYAQALGESVGCTNVNDTLELVDCLRQQNASDIVLKSAEIMIGNLILAYVPVVEPAECGVFFTENPVTLLEEGRFNQVPTIIGFNHDEGSLIYQYVESLCQNIDDNYFDNIMPLFIRVLTDYKTNLINISYAIKDEYYNIDLSDSSAVTRATLNVMGDMFMISGSVQAINVISQYVPTWMYEFNYVGNWSWNYFTGAADCTHGIDLIYLYNFTDVPALDEEDTQLSDSIVKLWADFAVQGNPTPAGSVINWPTVPTGQTVHLSIDQPLQVYDVYESSRMTFWLETVPEIAAATEA